MNETAKALNVRAFVANMILLATIGLPITGIANHKYGFSPLSIERHAWMSAHNVLGLLFVLFSIWHIVLNRRAVWNHLKNATSRISVVSREAILAVLLTAGALLLFVGHALVVGSR